MMGDDIKSIAPNSDSAIVTSCEHSMTPPNQPFSAADAECSQNSCRVRCAEWLLWRRKSDDLSLPKRDRAAGSFSRRKTKVITLTMLAGTAIVLSGCWDDDKPKLVRDEQECAEQMNDQEGCHDAAVQARKEFEKSAPRFDNQKDCETQFGPDRCTKTSKDGSNWFMPAMAGFMIGRMLDGGNQYRVQLACRNGVDVYAGGCGPVRSGGHVVMGPHPYVYAGRVSGGNFTPAPEYAGSWTAGKVAASRVSFGPASAGSVARGGFGVSAVGAVGE
jgi:uncharacterized protein YgiB involved in biofilm formation